MVPRPASFSERCFGGTVRRRVHTERVEDFKVGNLLGKGSFAGVYRAESIHTGLEVAIKMVRMY